MEDKMSINQCFTNTVFILEFNNTKICIDLYLKFLWMQAGYGYFSQFRKIIRSLVLILSVVSCM